MRLVLSSGSRTWGGLEAMAESLARGLARRGHHVVCFCRRESPLHRRLAEEIPCEPILAGERLHPLTLLRCARALRRHRPDVVIGNTMKEPGWTGVAARLLGIPVVHRHEFNIPYPDRPLDRLLFGSVPVLHVVNSEASRRTVLSAAGWIDPRRVAVVPNGIDVRCFAEAPPARLGFPAGATVFGFVGRWERAKGVQELAAAWPTVAAALPGARLVVAGLPGDPEERGGLRGDPCVTWRDFQQEIPALMKALDVLVLPSHREGFGLVLVEAMAAGAAVIASDTSAIPEIVTDGVEGLLVPPRDPAALAAAMLRLGSDPALRRRMGEAGHAAARSRFSAERMLDEHDRLLREVIRSR